ncbi:hypothetical protein LCGC14_2430870 [marine sediment metagenome]|uniref:Uncharacterized protein n=1 Tax=marine sediment metagenome TaxID=412755 RepID=A0A0F9C9B2_9ZZZZ
MAEKIQTLITLITNDLKEALDILFGIVEERIIWEPTGYPRESLKEIKRKPKEEVKKKPIPKKEEKVDKDYEKKLSKITVPQELLIRILVTLV